MTIKALVFDAYGTLYDVHFVVQRVDQDIFRDALLDYWAAAVR